MLSLVYDLTRRRRSRQLGRRASLGYVQSPMACSRQLKCDPEWAKGISSQGENGVCCERGVKQRDQTDQANQNLAKHNSSLPQPPGLGSGSRWSGVSPFLELGPHRQPLQRTSAIATTHEDGSGELKKEEIAKCIQWRPESCPIGSFRLRQHMQALQGCLEGIPGGPGCVPGSPCLAGLTTGGSRVFPWARCGPKQQQNFPSTQFRILISRSDIHTSRLLLQFLPILFLPLSLCNCAKEARCRTYI